MTESSRRPGLPARLRSRLGTALLALPDPVLERWFSGTIGYTHVDVPPPVTAPSAAIRLLVAPANSAGQGYAWARAAETLPYVGARNLFVSTARSFPFPADATVSMQVFQKSHGWGRRQARAVHEGFTHVLVEAERPILGRHAHGDVRREHRLLRDAGIVVGYVSHGSDLRLPSRHADLDEWSPYRDRDWEQLPRLEHVAAENARLLAEVAEPVFVSTPELTLDVPEATWLPNCVNLDRWRVDAAPLAGPRPRVVHAPTNPRIKGSDLIAPAVERLAAQGVIDYRRVSGVAPDRMPGLYASTDVVLEQFRLGAYGTTAIEAMAAGRLVVGHVTDRVRAMAAERADVPLPIVEATAATLADVLADVAARPHRYADIAAQGPAYVAAVHTLPAVGRVLQGFLRPVP